MIRRAFSTILLTLVTAAAVVGCGSGNGGGGGDGASPSGGLRTLETVRQDGTLRVGVNPNFPPMSSYGASNQLEGFDVDVANRIGEALGVKVQIVPTEAAQRVPFLTSGRIDLSLGALTITPERQQLIDYTVPLHTEAMSVLTTDRLQVESWQQLDSPDVTLVNMRGNLSVQVLKEKLPKAKVLLVDGNADTVRALAQGRADALVENIDFFMNFTKNYPDVKWRTLPDHFFVAQCGIGVAKGNDSLRTAVDALLRQWHADGTIATLWQKWYGAPMAVPVTL